MKIALAMLAGMVTGCSLLFPVDDIASTDEEDHPPEPSAPAPTKAAVIAVDASATTTADASGALDGSADAAPTVSDAGGGCPDGLVACVTPIKRLPRCALPEHTCVLHGELTCL